jgi:hypothetical protein
MTFFVKSKIKSIFTKQLFKSIDKYTNFTYLALVYTT